MADKRISQLTDRGTVANSDVVPIVVSGAVTTNKATISSIQTFMQGNLDLGVTSVGITLGTTGTNINVTGSPVTSSGNITINIPTASATNRGALSSTDWSTFNNKLSSVGLTMPSAFTVANSPLTANGTIAVTGAGTVSQYVRGDGSLADFPQGGGGGGASVSYYLNGSVSQGTIGGVAYYEMNKTPILGAGTDYTINSNGYIASFITDAGDPSLLEIPGGNWNFETYFSASSGGGTPSFYVELYKVNSGGTATLIASNSGTPELIAFGTTITPYFSTLAVPTTSLTITDRLALRYYVTPAGRTITMHTENSHLCQIITTFTTGLTALNGLTAQVQNFATGTSGTDFNISSASSTHTFNLPDASASNRGVITTGTQTIAGYKIFNGTIGVNNDLQLVTVGTALNTFIKNINATGQTSIGSNGFGFNNANNIYFSGSSKGGGVFAFSNTATQTYTLQDASGTLAFTSDLNSYLPLTGGTLTGTLAGTAAVFSGSIDANNGTNSTNGIKVISSLSSSLFTGGIEFLRTTVTAGSKIEPIRDAALGGVGLRFLTTLNNSAESSGTLTTAMTIAPTGAITLTGALNGTSASFNTTNAITLTASDSRIRGGDTTGRLLLANSGTTTYGIFHGSSHATLPNAIQFYNDNTLSLSLASTGSATFSSSVTTPFLSVSSASGEIGSFDSSAASGGYVTWKTSGTTIADIGTSQQIFGTGGNDTFGINARGARSLVFGTNNAAKLTITSTGNVGIGTASPLQVASGRVTTTINGPAAGSAILNLGVGGVLKTFLYSDSANTILEGSNTTITLNASGSNFIALQTADVERMRITSAGDMIFQGGSSSKIHLFRAYSGDPAAVGLAVFNTAGTTVASINGNGGGIYTASLGTGLVYSNGGTLTSTNPSDERLKDNIEGIAWGLEEILKLRPVSYTWKNDTINQGTQFGFIAQEVQEVMPEAVKEFGEEEQYLGLEKEAIYVTLVKAIQELKAEIDSLKTK
jgi:hypothetical protein